MKVAVTGATGFVGTGLVERLHAEGHTVVVLARNPAKASQLFPNAKFPQVEIVGYTPTQAGEWQSCLASCDGVVNLAGAAIAERWTPEYKQEILSSRQEGTRTLVAGIQQSQPRPQVLVSASAIGFYGASETATFDESSPAGSDFLAEVCQAWEAEAQRATEAGVRVVILRIGIVLGLGGAIAKMLTPSNCLRVDRLARGNSGFPGFTARI